MNKIIIICLSLIFLGCSHSKSSNNSASSTPQLNATYSGTYNTNDIICYNSSLTQITAASPISNGYTEVLTISGNTYSSITTASGCTATTSGNITFTSNYTLDISNETVNSATNGTCAATMTLANSNISPTTMSITYTTGENFGSKNSIPFIYNQSAGIFEMLSVFTDSSGGYCFMVLSKQ